ncbi:unnamed protein product [Blepharisma stoltei]|uniref:Uncharacterized protein n=1 Tax=Blepharisma stoltei TaxID=1481888 RepID=A0AAU9JG71_9CILI|nr:unnamed protein product [Blepharisma stoltei]
MHKRKEFQLDKLSLRASRSTTNLGQIERPVIKRFTLIQRSPSSPNSPVNKNWEDASDSSYKNKGFSNNLDIEPINSNCENNFCEEDSLVRDLVELMEQTKDQIKEKQQPVKKASRVSKQTNKVQSQKELINLSTGFKIRTKVLSPQIILRRSSVKKENEKRWNLVH